MHASIPRPFEIAGEDCLIQGTFGSRIFGLVENQPSMKSGAALQYHVLPVFPAWI